MITLYLGYLFIVSICTLIYFIATKEKNNNTKFIIGAVVALTLSFIMIVAVSDDNNTESDNGGKQIASIDSEGEVNSEPIYEENDKIDGAEAESDKENDESEMSSSSYDIIDRPEETDISDVDRKYLHENEEKYRDKWVRIAGPVDSVNIADDGGARFSFDGASNIKRIHCYLMRDQDISQLVEGQYATIVGIDDGKILGQLIVRNCYIENIGDEAKVFDEEMINSFAAETGNSGSSSLFGTADLNAEEAIYVTAEEAYLDMKENQVACKTKYDGKVVAMTGEIDDIGTNIFGQEYVTFKTRDVLTGIQCFFKNDQMDYVASLSSGMTITLLGRAEIGSLKFKMGNCSPLEPDSIPEKTNSSNEEADTGSTASTGERNAALSAKSYLEYSSFSYNGLIKQLKYEGYTDEEATYGADNCGADWNEQAIRSAKSYIDFSAFSKSGLIEQLESEGFTTEEAAYGAENCGADWMEQASKSASSYLSYSSFSAEGLREQLEYEGFSEEEIIYGLSQNGY